ncbi:MAG: sialate O-acetylesterase [Gemmatimonadales bacterium]
MAQTTYHVYFLGGQSNMDGYGYVADLPSSLRREQAGVMIFHGNPAPDDGAPDGRGIWTTLRPGHGVGFSSDGTTNTYSNRFGVELSFAERLRQGDSDWKIALIKYSRGGTSIDTAAAGPYGSWEPDYKGLAGINQYDHFLATVKHAMAISDVDGDGVADVLVPKGIIWMQGESDAALTERVAQRYLANLTHLIGLIREAFGVRNLPVVIGRISDSGRDSDGKVWDYGAIVRAAQAEFVARDHAATLVTTTDRYEYSDAWHYDSNGYVDLGRRFADAIVRLEKKAR